MLVTVVGPNLPRKDQAKGAFHVHRAGCKDLDRYSVGGDTYADSIEVDSQRAVAEFIYPVDEFEYWDTDPDSYIDDLWVAPCVVRELPRTDPSG